MNNYVLVLDEVFSPFLILSAPEVGKDHAYTLLRPDGTDARLGDTINCRGGGGFGVVVSVRDRVGVPRALKLLKSSAPLDINSDAFAREIKLTNTRPFKHVLAVIDYGYGDAPGMPPASEPDSDVAMLFRATNQSGPRRYGYYVSPLIPGATLLRAIDAARHLLPDIAPSAVARDELHDHVLRLLLDVANGLVELERANVVHMDLKPNNILVYPSDDDLAAASGDDDDTPRLPRLREQYALIIDLGAGKSLLPSRTSDTDRSGFVCTKPFFPIERLDELDHHDGTISLKRLRAIGGAIDLFSFGRILEVILFDRHHRDSPRWGLSDADIEQDERKENFWQSIFGEQLGELEAIADQCLWSLRNHDRKRYGYPVFGSALELRRALAAIPFRAATAITASESLTDVYPGIRIRTGSDLVRVSRRLAGVVEHPVFQRLRRLSQLSLVSEIFPDGSHTRFTHCLRTYHLAKRFTWGLSRDTTFRRLFGREDVELLLASALLHDIGQYHFSHTIEDLRKIGDRADVPALKVIPHDQEFARNALDFSDGDVSIRELLASHGIDADSMLYVIDKRLKGYDSVTLNITRDVISGVMDVDRASYLIHDSERTGVAFGAAFDIESLIESLTIRWDPGEPISATNGVLAIEAGGVSAVEALLAAVYWMYNEVYWRHTNRAFMAAVKWVMRHLLHTPFITMNYYLQCTYGRTDWWALEFLAKQFDLYLAAYRTSGVNPLRDLLSLRRLRYKRVFSMRPTDADAELYDRVQRNIAPIREDYMLTAIALAIPGAAKPLPGEILLDIPLKPRITGEDTRGEAGTKGTIYVRRRHPLTKTPLERDSWIDLTRHSPFAKSMGPIENHGRKIRVFFAQSLLDRIPARHHTDLESIIGNVLSKV